MKSLLFWLLIAGGVYFFVRSLIAENRLSEERRDGAPLWKVWIAPWRYFSANLYTAAGEAARRDALRSVAWAFLLFLAACVVRDI
jgi:hypothetical protein